MTKELKPCPFCGGSGSYSNAGFGFIVKCKKCGSKTSIQETGKEAADTWNARATEKVKCEPSSYSCRACKSGTDEEIERLKTENARLREALELIAKSNFYFAHGEEEKQFRRVCEIARDALKGAENDA